MMSCGVMPSVRAALGEARAYYEDPQRTILVRPHAAQIAEESGEKPWRLKSSAAIMVHTHKITRWTQGMNIVVRGAIQSVEKPNTFLAMHCRFDAQDNVTVKRIYVPVCDDFSRVKGMARLPVTAENVAFAFRVMALAREDMKHKAGSYVLAPALLQRARQDLTGPS
jgi:hypothetical protein